MTSAPLQDKIIVIVGGTSGLGLSGALACTRAGAKVAVVGLDADSTRAAKKQLDALALAIEADAADPRTTPAAIDDALRAFGRLDGLYHVAGGSGRKSGDGPLHELTDEGWEYTQRLNLTSLVYSNRAAVKQFLKQGTGGSVLNMGSVLGFSPSPRHFATHAYAATKSAAIGLTRSAAAYYAPQNIRFNLVAPAVMQTPMSKRAAGDEKIARFIRGKQPLDGGRIGVPQDLDAAVIYFLSDASKFVTGQVLSIDGGWSVTEGQYES